MSGKGKASGFILTNKDAALVLGMVSRGDRDHDIAGWFGVNQGRIAEVKEGKFGSISAAPPAELPPKGPPGMKGRRLRFAVGKALDLLVTKEAAGLVEATAILKDALAKYNANEA